MQLLWQGWNIENQKIEEIREKRKEKRERDIYLQTVLSSTDSRKSAGRYL
jgi:hypothetical protein